MFIMKTIIEVQKLKKRFGTGANVTTILNGVNFTVKEGEFISIMGASGCGKSTLLYLLGGLDSPSEGNVLLMGNDISKMSDNKLSKFRCKEIGFVFQFYNLVQNLTVEENIMLPVKMLKKKVLKEMEPVKLDEICEIVDIGGLRKKYPYQLSGGQQQRVAIARSIVTNPSIILADEPTGNLDSKNGIAVMKLFREINQTKNITIVQVTHDEEKVKYGNRLICLLDGEIVNDVAVE